MQASLKAGCNILGKILMMLTEEIMDLHTRYFHVTPVSNYHQNKIITSQYVVLSKIGSWLPSYMYRWLSSSDEGTPVPNSSSDCRLWESLHPEIH
jgi:hypothetical protein